MIFDTDSTDHSGALQWLRDLDQRDSETLKVVYDVYRILFS